MEVRFAGFLCSAGVLSLVALTASAEIAPRAHEELFRIQRNINRNIVEFDARLLADGRIDSHHPVEAHWRLFAEDGRVEELTWLEKQFAYGFTVESQRDGFVLKLAALSKRAVRVERRGGHWRAALSIAGSSAVLESVWVQVEGAFLGPHVRFVELHGTDDRTGRRVAERIVNR